MTSQTVTDMREFEAALDGPVIHGWPKFPPYRKSGAELPQPGDVAWCGAVKVQRPRGDQPGINCPECLRLRELLS